MTKHFSKDKIHEERKLLNTIKSWPQKLYQMSLHQMGNEFKVEFGCILETLEIATFCDLNTHDGVSL